MRGSTPGIYAAWMLITLNLGCQRSAEAPWAPLPVPVTREPAGGSATAPPERPQKRPPPPSEAPWLPPPLAALDPIDSSEGENDPAAPPAPVVGLSLDVFAPFATSVSVAGTFNAWTPGVALLEPTSDGRWVGLVAEARVGDRYKLVIETPSGQLWRNDPAARAVTNSVGESMVVDPHFDWSVTDFEPVPWNSTVIYEMHIGTFVDEPEGGPGTFDSAIEKLDDLAALGVTHLQLMPVAEFAGDFSWGYNPAHPFAVESSYGGLDAMRRFVDAPPPPALAARLGPVDVVYNHFGPSDLDLWRFDGWFEGEGGGVYFYNDDRAATPWGHTRPDYGRAQVRSYLRENALYWLDDLRVDGLRFDSTGNIRARRNGGDGEIPEGWYFLQEVNNSIDELPTWKSVIAEDLGGIGAITRATEHGGAGFDAQWDASFVHPVRDALIAGHDDHRSMHHLRTAIGERIDDNAFGRIIYTESHDEVANGRSRIPEEVWPGNASSWFSQRRAELGLALTLTSPGVPMLFQGQEFLEDGWFTDTDPLDWSKRTEHADVWSTTQRLISLRRNREGRTAGLTGPHVNVYVADEYAKVLAYHRWAYGGPGDDVVVVARFRDGPTHWYEVGMPHCGGWTVEAAVGELDDAVPRTGQALLAGPDAKDGMGCSTWIELPPYSALVLSRD